MTTKTTRHAILEGLSALIGGASMLAFNVGHAANRPSGLNQAAADLGAAIGCKPVNLSLAANALLREGEYPGLTLSRLLAPGARAALVSPLASATP